MTATRLLPELVSGPSCSCYHSFQGRQTLRRLSLHFTEPPCELPALEPWQQAATAPGGVEQVISRQGVGRRGQVSSDLTVQRSDTEPPRPCVKPIAIIKRLHRKHRKHSQQVKLLIITTLLP